MNYTLMALLVLMVVIVFYQWKCSQRAALFMKKIEDMVQGLSKNMQALNTDILSASADVKLVAEDVAILYLSINDLQADIRNNKNITLSEN